MASKTVAQLDTELDELREVVEDMGGALAALVDGPSGTIEMRMRKAMEAVGVVGKDHRNPQHNYNFRSVDDLVNQLQPALLKAGLALGSEVVATATDTYTTRNGTTMRWAMVHMRYTFYGPHGDHISAEGVGEAADASDKAHMKAMQQAYKYALLQALCVPTGEPDADATSPELGNGAQAKPSDYTNWAKAKVLDEVGGDTDAAVRVYTEAVAAVNPEGEGLTEAEGLAVYAAAKQLAAEAKQQQLAAAAAD